MNTAYSQDNKDLEDFEFYGNITAPDFKDGMEQLNTDKPYSLDVETIKAGVEIFRLGGSIMLPNRSTEADGNEK